MFTHVHMKESIAYSVLVGRSLKASVIYDAENAAALMFEKRPGRLVSVVLRQFNINKICSIHGPLVSNIFRCGRLHSDNIQRFNDRTWCRF